jgi:hypothetical protein
MNLSQKNWNTARELLNGEVRPSAAVGCEERASPLRIASLEARQVGRLGGKAFGGGRKGGAGFALEDRFA